MQKEIDNQSVDKQKPIVYACSGCSNLAQIAHDLALNIDRDGYAEMSCISGVIGGVEPIKNFAHSGRPIIVIDGCGMACTRTCCEAVKMNVDLFIDISTFGFEVRSKQDNHLSESVIAMNKVYQKLEEKGYKRGARIATHPHQQPKEYAAATNNADG